MKGDLVGLVPELVGMLKKLERKLNGELELNVTSGFRPGDRLAHGRGRAVDVAIVGGYQRRIVVAAALAVGFPRIGIYRGHVHLDVDLELPQPVIWSG